MSKVQIVVRFIIAFIDRKMNKIKINNVILYFIKLRYEFRGSLAGARDDTGSWSGGGKEAAIR